MRRTFKIVLAGALLAGCAGHQPPTTMAVAPSAGQPPAMPEVRRPMTAEEFCQKAMTLLGSPYIDPAQKQALIEKMRNRGCLR